MRKEKGITLVALVITIIVLIILAAVSIRAVMNDGIIINAKGAKESWEAGITDEEGKLSYLLGKIEGKESENGSLTIEKTSGEKLTNYRIYGNSVQGKLPNEYQQVEYIESTGTQYIDTGINPSSKTKFEIKTEFPDAENLGIYQAMGWGAAGSNEAFFIAIDTRYPDEDFYGVRLAVSDNYESISTGFVDVSKPMLISISNGNQSINDVTYGTITITRTGQSLYLFALHNGWNTIDSYTHSKLYFSKIYENDRLVRDLIPCYRKSDNVIGLYDLVENKFYTNAGTGEFVKGNNVTPTPTPEAPIEIKSVGDYDEATGKYKIPIKVNEETTNIYLDEPLRKIGDYADYIDFEKQKVVRQIKTLNLGSLTYTRGTYGSINLFYCSVKDFDWKFIVGSNSSLPILCEKYSSHTQKYSDILNDSIFVGNATFQNNCIAIRNDDYVDASSLKASLDNELIYYILEKPIDKTIDLPEIKTAKGKTNITIDTVTTPSKIEVDY